MYILKTVNANMQAHGGFVWPTQGPVEAPDWNAEPVCGGGLHGLPNGEGDGSLLNWSDEAKWVVWEAKDEEVVIFEGRDKCKAPRGNVLFVGNRKEATDYLQTVCPGRAIVGAYVVADYQGGHTTAGDRGHATAGNGGHATAGYEGHATAGDEGHATAGDRGHATAGYKGHATAGNGGHATAGNGGGHATAGDRGHATAGNYGRATAGDRGHATAGDKGRLQIDWWDAKADRYRTAIAYVGEDGIEPNVTYKLDDEGKFIKVEE